MPDTIMVEHAIGNVTMRAVNRNIVHICHVMFDTADFVSRIFFEEPAMAREVLCQVFSLTSQAETDLLCEDTRRPAANPHVGTTASRKNTVVKQQNLERLGNIIAEGGSNHPLFRRCTAITIEVS